MFERFIRIAVLSMVCTLFITAASCRTKTEAEPTSAGEPIAAGEAASSYSAFGIDLYLEATNASPSKNVFLSPASVGLALAMTWNGSEGDTRKAMAQTLRLRTTEFVDVNAADSSLIAGLSAGMNGVELTIANSLWGRQGAKFKRDFLARNERYYGAELRSLDFSDPGAPGIINAWAAQQTRGRISSIVDRIDPFSTLFLVNAIYFKGAWKRAFDESLTSDEVFHGASGDKIVPMMRQSGKYAYLEGDGFQAARLPYGDGRAAMYVFLPDSQSSLSELRKRLSPETWTAWLGGFANRDGEIALPRFTIEYETKLKGTLTALGMGIAFDGSRADFRGLLELSGANAYIHEVVHKTFCEVNEKGTEAAAVTSVEIRVTSVMQPMESFTMICDRPFLFAIVDGTTGLVLFMGSLEDPS